MDNEFDNSMQGRPGDTSSYSTDASCGYTAPNSSSAGSTENTQNAAQNTAPTQNIETAHPTESTEHVEAEQVYYGNNGSAGNAGGPSNSDPAANGFYASKPPKQHRHIAWGSIAKKAVALVVVAAVGFGGGMAGAKFANAGKESTVVYKSVDNSATTTEASGSADSSVSTVSAATSVSPSVVVITTEQLVNSNTWFGGSYVQSGAGSGVIISDDGKILTCAHVVSGASNIKVTLNDGTEYDATVLGCDTKSDVAVVKIEATGLTPAVLGDSDALQVGENVLAVGNPMGELGGSVSSGIVSALNREITINSSTMNVIQMDASVSPGNSGGGLFNLKGELIGIVNAKSTGDYAEGLGFAIPINTAMKVADDLISNGYVTGRPAMGISVVEISSSQAAMQYGVNAYGVYVAEVNSGSGAEAGGMQKGDMIVSVDNTTVSTTAELTEIIGEHSVGDTLEVIVNRNRQLVTLQVTLGESTQTTSSTTTDSSSDQQQEQPGQDQYGQGQDQWPFFGQMPQG